MFSTGFTSLTVLRLFLLSTASSSCTIFDAISSFKLFHIDDALLINPSHNAFVLGDFIV